MRSKTSTMGKAIAGLAMVAMASSVASASLVWDTTIIEGLNGTSFMTGSSVANFSMKNGDAISYGGESWVGGSGLNNGSMPFTSSANGFTLDFRSSAPLSPGASGITDGYPDTTDSLLDYSAYDAYTRPYILTLTGFNAGTQYLVSYVVVDARDHGAIIGRTSQMHGTGIYDGTDSTVNQYAYGPQSAYPATGGQFAVFQAKLTGENSLAVEVGNDFSQLTAVRIAVIPEPTSGLLVIAGAAGLGLLRRKIRG